MKVNYDAMITQISEMVHARMLGVAEELSVVLATLETSDLLWNEEPDHPIKGFSDLHDYCDANELGGMCCVLITDAFENDEEWMDFAQRVQDRIHHKIVNKQIDSMEIEFVKGQQ